MAEWKKVIVSGSHAHLASVTASNLTDDRLVFSDDSGALKSTDITVNSNLHLDGNMSGSFSGSFDGDGSGLTGITLDNSLVDGAGIVDFTFDGSAAATVSVDSGSLAGDGIETNAGAFRVQLSGSSLNRDANGIGIAVDGVATDKIADSAVTFAKVQDLSTMTVIGRTAAGTGVSSEVSILDEDNMASDSATALATQQSIKAYVDAQLGASDLDITDGTNSDSIDLDSETLTFTGGGGITATVSSGTVTFGATVSELGGGLVSGSAQVVEHLPAGTVSGSSQVNADSITNFDSNVKDKMDADGVISGSAQIRPLFSAVDTTGAAGIDMSYDSSNGQFSGSLVNSSVGFAGDSGATQEIDLGADITVTGGTNVNTAMSANTLTINLDSELTGLEASGSFSGSFQGDGSNLTGIATSLNITDGTNNDSVDLKTDTLTIAGTSNEVDVTVSDNQIQIGLPNDVVIAGNLTVQGTRTELQVQDLVVEDQFIYLASGSSGATDGGIIIEGTGASDGKGFGYDTGASRWGFQNDMVSGSTDMVPTAFASQVVTNIANTGSYQYKGNIYVDASDDIYIYV